jgi:hypothetical protein
MAFQLALVGQWPIFGVTIQGQRADTAPWMQRQPADRNVSEDENASMAEGACRFVPR